jgi:hypothetical protein
VVLLRLRRRRWCEAEQRPQPGVQRVCGVVFDALFVGRARHRELEGRGERRIDLRRTLRLHTTTKHTQPRESHGVHTHTPTDDRENNPPKSCRRAAHVHSSFQFKLHRVLKDKRELRQIDR